MKIGLVDFIVLHFSFILFMIQSNAGSVFSKKWELGEKLKFYINKSYKVRFSTYLNDGLGFKNFHKCSGKWEPIQNY